jgi:hypothetical protein
MNVTRNIKRSLRSTPLWICAHALTSLARSSATLRLRSGRSFMTMRPRWPVDTVFFSWSMRGRSGTRRNKSRNSSVPSRLSGFRWRRTFKIMMRQSLPSSLRSLGLLSEPRSRSRKSKNFLGKSRSSRKSSVRPSILNHL